MSVNGVRDSWVAGVAAPVPVLAVGDGFVVHLAASPQRDDDGVLGVGRLPNEVQPLLALPKRTNGTNGTKARGGGLVAG